MILTLNFTLLILVVLLVSIYYICKIFSNKNTGGNIKTLYKVEHISSKSYPIKKSNIIQTQYPIQTNSPINLCQLSDEEYKNSEKNVIYYLYKKNIDNKDIILCDKILLKNQLDLSLNGVYKVVKLETDYVELVKLIDTNTIIGSNAFKFIDFYLNSQPNIKWSSIINNKYYKSNHLVLKSSSYNSDREYIQSNINTTTKWHDSSNNFLKNSMLNNIFYNNNKNHIFTFNNNKFFNINFIKTDKLKSIILVLHNIDKNINIIHTDNEVCSLKLLNDNSIITGIKKIVINNESINLNDNIYNKIHNKSIILYIEFEYNLSNININKQINYNTDCNGYIYEIRCFSNYLEYNKYTDLINFLNCKWNVYLNNFNDYKLSSSSNICNINQNITSTLGVFDGFLINKDVIIKNLDKNIDYIKKQILLDNKVILVDVASTSNININNNSVVDSEDITNDLYIPRNTKIDNTILKNNFIVFLKNQTNINQNGIYLYNKSLNQLIKQNYNISEIKDKYFSIIYGNINKNTYWRIDKDSSNNQKIFKDNLYIPNELNPINFNFFLNNNSINPNTSVCNIVQEDEDVLCSNKKPCNYNNSQGCILLNNKIPVNLNHASTKHIKISRTQHIISEDTCNNYESLNINNDCNSDTITFETNNLFKLYTTFIDSSELKCNQYILLKNQTNSEENGIYRTIEMLPKNRDDLILKYNNYIKYINKIYQKLQNNNSNLDRTTLSNLCNINGNIYQNEEYEKIFFDILEKPFHSNIYSLENFLLNNLQSSSSIKIKKNLSLLLSKSKTKMNKIKLETYWIINKINIENNMKLLSCKIKEIINDSNMPINLINFDNIIIYINSGKINKNKLFNIKKIGNSITVNQDRFIGGLGISDSLDVFGFKEDVEFQTMLVGELFHGILGVSNLSKHTIKSLFHPKTGKIWTTSGNVLNTIDTTITNTLDKYSKKNFMTKQQIYEATNIKNYINL